MSITIIRREGSKDRERRIYESVKRRQPYNMPVAGVTQSVDEAQDIAYHRHDYGETDQPFLVQGDSPEMKQAHESQMLRVGQISGVPVDPDHLYREWQKEEAERQK
mgnify:FL=1